MTTDDIRKWLRSSGNDRSWLATQIGCTVGTLNQWFSKGFPEWATKSIERMANPLKDNTAGLEVAFTHAEWKEIEEAMRLTGYTRLSDFYHDTICERAEAILASGAPSSKKIIPTHKKTFASSKVAEEPTAYSASSGKRPKT